jgi:hypothetical protein
LNGTHTRARAGTVVAKKGIVGQIEGFFWGIINFFGLFFSTVNPVGAR